MKILAVSDNRLPQFSNSEFLMRQFSDVQALISCGDMDPDYLDFIASVLNLPLYFVRGNHDHHYSETRPGGTNLHAHIKRFQGFTLAGLEGSIRYNRGDVQYSESAMFGESLRILPALMLRRLVLGYGVDVMVAHSPPRNLNDADDWAHRGFRTFRWILRLACPRYFIHGHVDIYDRRQTKDIQFLKTKIININPYFVLDIADR